ncbi:MAG: MCP four helix bundle domain-containing protein [Nitrospiraceae bacterium]
MRWWKGLKLIMTTRAVLAWSGALVTLTGSIGTTNLDGPSRASLEALQANRILVDLRDRSHLMWGLVAHHVAAQSSRDMAALAKEIAAVDAELANRWKAYEPLSTSTEERAAYLKYRASWSEYVKARDATTLRLSTGNRKADAYATLKTILEPTYQEAISHLREAMTEHDDRAVERSTAGRLLYESSRASLIWLSLGALGLSLSLGWILARVITRGTREQMVDDANRATRLIAPARS